MPALYIIATPIGNLEDITVRALKVMRQVDFIACEDTRKTRILTSRYHIKTRLIPYHEYNKKRAADGIVANIIKGKDAALVSEAGTPLISDPGSYLVRLCIEKGIRIIPIPGPSSILSAISASGLDVSEFTFIGFLPKKAGKRKKLLTKLKEEKRVFIVFEPARSVEKLLEDILDLFGNARICYAKELTKVYEFVKTQDLKALMDEIKNKPELLKGEITLVIEPPLLSASPHATGFDGVY
ncbi:MAG: 16S rRNA (cytidine(1402)-2'-O)-methyltransferase [Candidatus Acidulodesulfobacterium ferriphilum]|jgi:16S rRNA (cytidine1402-2'-O)-methyltransferase|uniref:Ribosomal RNA small subunit methyltransferase I n=1 Tax=Candidatus Acidulodesulfobacterium ferriphilum TaxID=2597223 RepID=A0A519BD93_9DELT|nr:MAG: 16S rRNA (cytidine(1402)-2'-O)-methyltransferase [Candidatus Acidulodesulfobacterium ferriphilum]